MYTYEITTHLTETPLTVDADDFTFGKDFVDFTQHGDTVLLVATPTVVSVRRGARVARTDAA